MSPIPKTLIMSEALQKGRAKGTDWLQTPALTAAHLSRGRWWRARHLDYISEKIAKIRDRPIFLIITMPPRHGKSELISHWTPVWFLKNWPYKRIILASYQSGFAAEWGGDAKDSIIENEQELNLQLMTDTKAKARWRIRGYGGGMVATGIGGPLTGRGGDLIIVDDPIKSQREALSPVYRESIKQWYRATLRTRKQPGGSMIILMTRWHEEDLAGWLLSENPEDLDHRDPWEVLNLPALAEADDPLGREEGDPLWPEMYGMNELLTLREAIGPYWWSAEYQGSPRPEGGAIIKEPWFRYYSKEDDPLSNPKLKIQRCIEAWDTAFEKGEENSRTACCTFIETKLGYHLADVWANRVEFPDLVEIVKAKYSEFVPQRVYIEHKASGHSLVQQLRRDTKLPIIPVKAQTDKTARVHAVSGVVEAGRVLLPIRAPWLSEFLHEVCTFPAAKFNDITDAFAHGLMQLQPTRVKRGTSNVKRGTKKSIWRD